MSSQVLYNPQYNLEYYHITKNGMTSIIPSLGMSWFPIDTIPEDRKVLAIIRDPITRFLSGYLEVTKYYKAGLLDGHVVRKPKLKIFGGTNQDTFLRYLEEIEKRGWFDGHNAPQHTFMSNELPKKGSITHRNVDKVTDFVLFENMNKGLNELIGKGVHLLRNNVGNANSKLALKSVCEANSDRIINIYREDYNLHQSLMNRG